jgi:hypothetical protein
MEGERFTGGESSAVDCVYGFQNSPHVHLAPTHMYELMSKNPLQGKERSLNPV